MSKNDANTDNRQQTIEKRITMYYEYDNDYDDYEMEEENKHKPKTTPKEFYVYVHTNSAGEILYVGNGIADAWFSKKHMSTDHKEAIRSGKITGMNILTYHSSLDASAQAKRKLIAEHEPILNEKVVYDPKTYWEEDITRGRVNLSTPKSDELKLFKAELEEFLEGQAGKRRKLKETFSLKADTPWGQKLKGKKLEKLKKAIWLKDMCKFYNYEIVSVAGRAGGTTIAPK